MSLIFDIKRYAINDGPGIRITIFMKGCPLSCVWCHNPEGVSIGRQKMYTEKRCIGCRTCVDACPRQALVPTEGGGIATDSRRCRLCGACTDVCPSLAMEMSGKDYSVDYLMGEIEKETVVMDQSGGGVTFCGGEPLLHPELLLELLRRCGRLGIHRTVDTTLFATPALVAEVANHAELFLVDLKHMDSAKHRRFCGVPNERILCNLQQIAGAGMNFVVRIPLIEGVNADEENIRRSAAFLASLAWQHRKVNLLPYHDIGRGKHEKLGTVYNPEQIPMSAPSEEAVQRCRDIFGSYGIEAVVGG